MSIVVKMVVKARYSQNERTLSLPRIKMSIYLLVIELKWTDFDCATFWQRVFNQFCRLLDTRENPLGELNLFLIFLKILYNTNTIQLVKYFVQLQSLIYEATYHLIFVSYGLKFTYQKSVHISRGTNTIEISRNDKMTISVLVCRYVCFCQKLVEITDNTYLFQLHGVAKRKR